MSKCVHCGSETALLVSGIPVCVDCDLSPEKTLKVIKANVGLSGARARWRTAKSELEKADEIVASLPPGHPDGTKALKQANAVLSKAGKELQAALSAYLEADQDGKERVNARGMWNFKRVGSGRTLSLSTAARKNGKN